MLNTKYIFLLAATVLVLFNSCGDDSFSQVVEIDIPPHEAKPVLKMQAEAGDDELRTLLSISKGILEEGDFELPDDAVIKAYKNDLEFATFGYYDNLLKYGVFLNEPISFQGGDEYRIEAKVPGYDLATVTQIMPKKPTIVSATYEKEGTISSDGDRVDEVVVELENIDIGETNYYALAVYFEFFAIDDLGDTIQHSRNHVYLDSNDPLLTYSDNYDLVFTDNAFEDNTIQVRAYTYESMPAGSVVSVQLYHLSRDAYLYEVSLNQYSDAIDNPFAEPVTVHSNVENGYGIFTLSNYDRFYIEQ